MDQRRRPSKDFHDSWLAFTPQKAPGVDNSLAECKLVSQVFLGRLEAEAAPVDAGLAFLFWRQSIAIDLA